MTPILYVGAAIFLALALYLFIAKPSTASRAFLETIVNVILFAFVIYIILVLFKVLTF